MKGSEIVQDCLDEIHGHINDAESLLEASNDSRLDLRTEFQAFGKLLASVASSQLSMAKSLEYICACLDVMNTERVNK